MSSTQNEEKQKIGPSLRAENVVKQDVNNIYQTWCHAINTSFEMDWMGGKLTLSELCEW